MKKRISAILLIICLMVAMIPTNVLATSGYTDMPQDYSTAALEAAVKNGLLNGSDNKLMPNENLTRAQMAAILVRAFGAEEKADISAFSDVSPNAWYHDDMSKAVHMGLFKGDGTNLNPDAAITRQEAFTVLARAIKPQSPEGANLNKFSDKNSVATWAKDDVTAMIARGYVNGADGKINPTSNISRKDFAVTIDRMIKNYITKSATVTAVNRGSVMVNTAEVTLKNVTIDGDLIIGDGVLDGDITLDNVTVSGRTIVRGGGTDSIIIKGNSKLGTIAVAKVNGDVRIAIEGKAVVGNIDVLDGKNEVIVEGRVETVNVSRESTPVIIKNAQVKNLNLTAENANLSLQSGAEIGTIAVTSPKAHITVGKGADVSVIAATKEATEVMVTVDKSSNVANIVSAAADTVVINNGNLGTVSLSKDATNATYVVGDNASSKTVVITENKDNLVVTTQDAYEAKQAAEKALAEKVAAEKALADANTVAEKAAAEKALADATETAKKAEETAKKEEDAGKTTVDKVEGGIKEETVTPPTMGDDGAIVVPDLPTPPTPGGGGGTSPSYSYTVTIASTTGGK